MVSTPYMRGRAWEYKAIKMLRSSGWVCSRSAMSHGPVDIFAANGKKVLLIQVKSGAASMRKDERDILVKWAKAFKADAEVWHFRRRGKLEKIQVHSKRQFHRPLPRTDISSRKVQT
ncbi:MAG: hypothetical protein HY619_06205 [Thaumarchaeota archaeon]|nr:hypothetical protein [Nitrososphaerota archaeon]